MLTDQLFAVFLVAANNHAVLPLQKIQNQLQILGDEFAFFISAVILTLLQDTCTPYLIVKLVKSPSMLAQSLQQVPIALLIVKLR